jgi:SAM-dependent methyltransferase
MLHPREALSTEIWSDIVAEMDIKISGAITAYIDFHGIAPTDVAHGYNQLARLRESSPSEPDYRLPGVPVAYAFAYLALRASSTLAALASNPRGFQPRRVLDVGSGSGAIALALSLLRPTEPIEIYAVEPSKAMRDFAELLPLSPLVKLKQIEGDLAALVAKRVAASNLRYDLISFSAVFPYEEELRVGMGAWLRWAAQSTDLLVVIEPEAKATKVKRILGELKGTKNCTTAILNPESMAKAAREPIVLDRTTRLKYDLQSLIWDNLEPAGKRIFGDPPFSSTSWWQPFVHEEVALLSLSVPSYRYERGWDPHEWALYELTDGWLGLSDFLKRLHIDEVALGMRGQKPELSWL